MTLSLLSLSRLDSCLEKRKGEIDREERTRSNIDDCLIPIRRFLMTHRSSKRLLSTGICFRVQAARSSTLTNHRLQSVRRSYLFHPFYRIIPTLFVTLTDKAQFNQVNRLLSFRDQSPSVALLRGQSSSTRFGNPFLDLASQRP